MWRNFRTTCEVSKLLRVRYCTSYVWLKVLVTWVTYFSTCKSLRKFCNKLCSKSRLKVSNCGFINRNTIKTRTYMFDLSWSPQQMHCPGHWMVLLFFDRFSAVYTFRVDFDPICEGHHIPPSNHSRPNANQLRPVDPGQ